MSDTSTKKRQQDQLNGLIKTYLDDMSNMEQYEVLELEVKFGTKGIKPITRIDYDNVVKKLLSSGFTIKHSNHILRIQCEYLDSKTGVSKMSNIRAEINGLHNVRTYCKTNNILLIDNGVSYIQKQNYTKDNKVFSPVSFDDFNFRVSLNSEHSWNNSSQLVRITLDNWLTSKKTFRYMNRFTLMHPTLPFLVDMSIVKSSRKNGRYFIPEYTIQDAGVFDAPESYEIEIECINDPSSVYNTPELLNDIIKKNIKIVLGGLQETNYPIAYSEQNDVLQEYMKLLWGDKYTETTRVNSRNFLGPSSFTLQVSNIAPINSDTTIPNIRNNYSVTDKADGDRKLLLIAKNGKIYLINTNMQVQFTGTITRNKDLFNSLFDGEHIIHDKKHRFLNMYAAFDIYYLHGQDIRSKAFIPSSAQTNEDKLQFRLPILMNVIKNLKPESISGKDIPSPLLIQNKVFYEISDVQTIFQGCSTILQKEKDGLFNYETDGLIFTPSQLGVGSNKVGETIKPLKNTWDYSFKWKPVESNTIDFLISVKKSENGMDHIGNIFQSGINTSSSSQLLQYKTITLRIGFDESKHGYINPCQDVIDDKVPSVGNVDDTDKYVPMQFFPSNPSDDLAGITNIILTTSAGGGIDDKVMISKEGEVIEDNMIVEFSYDIDKEQGWRWSPLRVRYDKTAEYRSGMKNYGNAYHVANSNWHTIHNPITPEMLMTGKNIPDELADDEIYYNRKSGSGIKTKGLRDFHNLYVKLMLISRVSKPSDTLIDLAVGKGGDFPKWIKSRLKFVFGIDISKDNIQNRLDGACARFLNFKKKFKVMPDVLFVNGNSGINIRNTNALESEKDKQITRAVFGQGPKDQNELGKGVYKQYAVGSNGFDICSIQFAIHYMFENKETLHNFLRNVSETTKLGGYFIGTSYDGNLIFRMLKNKSINESSIINEGEKKIWEVIKKYDNTDFPDNAGCLGYAIDVFQESINKVFREYLVNYNYLTRLLENYGFILLPKEESMRFFNITSGTGLFSDLYANMINEIKRNPLLAKEYGESANMTPGEKTISFLNRYFVYKKISNVDADKVSQNLLGKTFDEELEIEDISKQAKESIGIMATISEIPSLPKTPPKKTPLKRTLKLKLKPSN
jgi:hypothetical protein